MWTNSSFAREGCEYSNFHHKLESAFSVTGSLVGSLSSVGTFFFNIANSAVSPNWMVL